MVATPAAILVLALTIKLRGVAARTAAVICDGLLGVDPDRLPGIARAGDAGSDILARIDGDRLPGERLCSCDHEHILARVDDDRLTRRGERRRCDDDRRDDVRDRRRDDRLGSLHANGHLGDDRWSVGPLRRR
jgi:hypothetical protein